MDRPIFSIHVSSIFEKSFSSLPKRIQLLAEKKERLFRNNAFHASLRTHKLSGELQNDWAYWVNKHYRVHFYFVDNNSAMFLDIGTHEIYK